MYVCMNQNHGTNYDESSNIPFVTTAITVWFYGLNNLPSGADRCTNGRTTAIIFIHKALTFIEQILLILLTQCQLGLINYERPCLLLVVTTV